MDADQCMPQQCAIVWRCWLHAAPCPRLPVASPASALGRDHFAIAPTFQARLRADSHWAVGSGGIPARLSNVCARILLRAVDSRTCNSSHQFQGCLKLTDPEARWNSARTVV